MGGNHNVLELTASVQVDIFANSDKFLLSGQRWTHKLTTLKRFKALLYQRLDHRTTWTTLKQTFPVLGGNTYEMARNAIIERHKI